jgi:hypothetical protein
LPMGTPNKNGNTKAMGSRKHNKLESAAVARETDRSPVRNAGF